MDSLKIPEIAWQGLFQDYLDLVSSTTEAANEFHYATFIQVLGCTLGRRLQVYHAGKQFPNFFTCLVGRSGLTRKSTCIAQGRDILDDLHAVLDTDSNPAFRVVKGIRSYEGLLEELAGERKTRLIIVDELLSLLSKAKQESTGNLIPQLTELYDCQPYINPPIKGKPVSCKEPFVSIMAATTESWLQKALTERDIYGGFANRWLYFCGTPKLPLPNPAKPKKAKRDAIINSINGIREWADSLAGASAEVSISSQADTMFTEYYTPYYERCQTEGLIPTLIVRIQDFTWKLALIYAAVDCANVIEAKRLEPEL